MSGSGDITRRTALGLLAAGALAGCGIDPDGISRPGLDLNAPVDDDYALAPPRPPAGASPEQIIRKFLEAGRASGPSLAVTRSYLTETVANQWMPDKQTVIFGSEQPTIHPLKGRRNFYRVEIRVVARIDSDGRYLVAPPNDSATFDFQLTKVDGEWRIDWMQKAFGRVLSRTDVDRLYRRNNVHYAAPGSNVLVPDQRWIPDDQEATRMVRFQLGDVPDYLTGAVTSETQAQLAIESVPVRGGVAQVDLAEDTVSSDAIAREQMAAELVATLTGVPGVTEVVIAVDGTPISFDDVEGALTSPTQFDYEVIETGQPVVYARDGKQVVEVDTRLASVTEARLGSAPSPFPAIDGSWRPLGVRRDGEELAGVGGTQVNRDQLARWPDDGPVIRVPRFAANLTRPCYDAEGWLWVGGAGLGREDGHRLFAINSNTDPDDTTKSAPQHIHAPWLGTRHVVAAVVSPEARRVAVISEEVPGAGSALHVSGIVREPNGLPTETSSSAVQVAANLVEMLDAVWVDSITLAVIGRTDEQRTMRPFLVDVNGDVSQLEERSGATGITTTGGEYDLVLTSPKGRVWQRVGGSWAEITEISGVAVSGV